MKKILYVLIALTIISNMVACTKTTIEIPVQPEPIVTTYTVEGYGFKVISKQVAGDSIVSIKVIPVIVDQDTQLTLQLLDGHGRKLNVWIVNLTKDLKEGCYYEHQRTVTVGSSLEEMKIVSGGLYFL